MRVEARATTSLAALLAAVARGEREALRDLYQRTSAKLYGICLRVLGNEAEAQDVLQEVYRDGLEQGRLGSIRPRRAR